MIRVLVLSVSLAFTASLAAEPHIETGADAEVSFDGLHRVKRSILDAAWVRPDLNLAGYSKLQLTSAGIAYRPWTGRGVPPPRLADPSQ